MSQVTTFSWTIVVVNVLDLEGNVAIPLDFLDTILSLLWGWGACLRSAFSGQGRPSESCSRASEADLPADAVSRSTWKSPTLHPNYW